MSVPVSSCTSWKVGECKATTYQMVRLFGNPIQNHIGDKVPFEWVIGFLNVRIYPYKFTPEDGNKVEAFSIGGTSNGQVIALQAFLDHVATSNIWAENGDSCPAIGIEVTSL